MNDELMALEKTLNLLMDQWNILNALKDETKRTKHLTRLELWITEVSALIDQKKSKVA